MSSHETPSEEVIVEAEVLSEEHAEQRPSTLPLSIGVALIGVVLAVGSAWYLGQQMTQESQQINDLQGQASQLIGRVESQQASISQQQGVIQHQQQAFEALKTRTESALQQQEQMVQQLLHNNREQSRQLNQSVAALARRVDRRETNLHTAAALRLLQIAEEQLMIAKDLESTQQALAQAGQQITASGDPILLPIYELIQLELKQVRATREPDLYGARSLLNEAIDAAETLPVFQLEEYQPVAVGSESSEPAIDEPWNPERIMNKVWQDLLTLIRIDKKEHELPIIATQSEIKMSRLILKLRLEQTQSTLLLRDSALFNERLHHALEWLQLFDQQSKAVLHIQQQLNTLDGLEIRTEPPIIGEAHRRLRAITAQRSADNAEATQEAATTAPSES
ncbi:MAG: hypothetical protein HOI61_04235 [Gammaproteobacteria bacterium]|jgi:uncharacterized protein HemX|nr:hypothetical protein [Gammaproteobacteria bacterium]MBT6878322.1 hypothetical protein [Gammaproteobacteria bacterium]MBT7141533.1 hypothetical protein [Gammaproteobacteria bacterium]MBT7478572.1 hypothetical protein [Gammaproteobacteria bacterium]HIJ22299.1 hypothetical protein [Gammaproteobacteria bacterium]